MGDQGGPTWLLFCVSTLFAFLSSSSMRVVMYASMHICKLAVSLLLLLPKKGCTQCKGISNWIYFDFSVSCRSGFKHEQNLFLIEANGTPRKVFFRAKITAFLARLCDSTTPLSGFGNDHVEIAEDEGSINSLVLLHCNLSVLRALQCPPLLIGPQCSAYGWRPGHLLEELGQDYRSRSSITSSLNLGHMPGLKP